MSGLRDAIVQTIGSDIEGGVFVTPVEELRRRYHTDPEFHYRVDATAAAARQWFADWLRERGHRALSEAFHSPPPAKFTAEAVADQFVAAILAALGSDPGGAE